MWGQSVGGPLERVQISVGQRALKLSFSRWSRLTQTFAETCVHFEVARLSILMVWRLPYLEIPTLMLLDITREPKALNDVVKTSQDVLWYVQMIYHIAGKFGIVFD